MSLIETLPSRCPFLFFSFLSWTPKQYIFLRAFVLSFHRKNNHFVLDRLVLIREPILYFPSVIPVLCRACINPYFYLVFVASKVFGRFTFEIHSSRQTRDILLYDTQK